MGADVQVASNTLYLDAAVQTIAEVTDRQVTFQYLPAQVFCEQFAIPSALSAAIGNQSQLGEKVDWVAIRTSMKVVGKGPEFKDWAEQHKNELRAHVDARVSRQ